MAEINAVTFISQLLDGEAMLIETVLYKIIEAPAGIKRYLNQRCKTIETMEEFLRSHDEYFMVENDRVANYDSNLEAGRVKAIDYFTEELRLYDESPNCMNFRGHIGQADADVIDFMNCFYPHEEFKNFLTDHPDVFIVFDDDTVNLVEDESVDFFEDCLKDYGEGLYYMNLRGHISHAPDHVIRYINNHYPEKKFFKFLKENSDVFDLRNGCVYLIPEE